MPEALNRWQLLDARKLQHRGLTLREIAADLGVSFEAVCLGLYGDNQSTDPVAKASEDNAITDLAKPDTDGAGDASRLSVASGSDAEASEQPFEAAPQGSRRSGDDSVSAVSSSPLNSQLPADAEGSRATRATEVGVGGETDSSIDAERLELLQHFHPAQRFKLVSDDGQTLHQSLHVLTRLPSFFWRGTAEQLSAVRRRRPQWASLKPVPIS